jgi:hypothetical protein
VLQFDFRLTRVQAVPQVRRVDLDAIGFSANAAEKKNLPDSSTVSKFST